jgi:uncharacterized protein (TIGR03437 family)
MKTVSVAFGCRVPLGAAGGHIKGVLHAAVVIFGVACSGFAQTYTIKTVAGNASLPDNVLGASANLPDSIEGIAVDAAGDVFVSLYPESVVLRLDSRTGILTRVAGNWTQGFSGDGGPATSAQLHWPAGLAVDASGNLYIVDTQNARVRKVDTNGVITTVVGNGAFGHTGDGGSATSAQLSPGAVAVDSSFNLYITDSGTWVRKVDKNGVITTVAGDGTLGDTGDGGSATSAEVGAFSIAVDAAGNLYIAGGPVRRVSNGVITTVAGGGSGFPGDGGPATSASLSAYGIAVDAAGNFYIVDRESRIMKVDGNDIITTVAGNGGFGDTGDGGPATNAALAPVFSIAADPGGNIYTASSFDNRIRKVSNGVITTIVGSSPAGDYSGPALSALLNAPGDVVADGVGNLYIADSFNNRVRKVSNGVITPFAGSGTAGFSGDGGPALSAALSIPAKLALDLEGNLYIADIGNNRIRKVSTNGIITTVAGNGSTTYSGDGLLAVSTGLSLLTYGQSSGARHFDCGITVDAAGNLYIVVAGVLRKVDLNGIITTVATGLGGMPSNSLSISLDTSGNAYVVDDTALIEIANGVTSTVTAVDSGTGKIAAVGEGGTFGAAVDTLGNIYVSTVVGIQRVSGGVVTLVAGTGTFPQGHSGDGGAATSAQLFGPTGITVDPSGNVYFVDSGNQSVRVLIPSGPACGYSVSSRALAAPSSGGTVTTSVGTSSSCLWAVSGLPDWITFSSPIVSTGASTVNLLVAPLTGTSRTATISIAGLAVTVTQQGTIASPFLTAVTNGASNLGGPIAPGEIVVLFGSGLGPAQLTSAHVGSDGLYDTQLAGTSVQFNGISAPMIYTSATQVAAIVPYEVTGASAQVTETYQGQTSASLTVPVAASAPGLFTLGSTGQGQAAAVNQNESINTASTPAHIGSIISLFATGEGQTSPAGVDGKPATTPLPTPNLPVNVTIGGVTVNGLQYVGGAPGEVAGLLQINVPIPAGITAGNAVPVVIRVGGAPSQAGVTIAVAGN